MVLQAFDASLLISGSRCSSGNDEKIRSTGSHLRASSRFRDYGIEIKETGVSLGRLSSVAAVSPARTAILLLQFARSV